MSGRLRFVIVDDNLASATTAKVLLEGAGYAASIIGSPEEALDKIPRDPPDAVLLDILMPAIDGLEVCSRLRATAGLESLKIIMCTSKSFEFDRRRAAEMGADGYIVKPIKKEPFLNAIARALKSDIEMTFWGVRGTLHATINGGSPLPSEISPAGTAERDCSFT